MGERHRSAGGRLSLITFDQVLSASSNILVAIASAHLLGVAAFGYFGVILVIYTAAQGMCRALVGDPLLVHPEDAGGRASAPVGAVLIIGGAMGALLAVAGGLLHLAELPLGAELLMLGLALPGLTLHDLGRYLGFASRRPSFSLAIDLLWLVLIGVALGALVLADQASLTLFVLAWLGTGALSSTAVLSRAAPDFRQGLAWLRRRWWYSWRFLMSFGTIQGASLAFMVAIAAAAGATALGAVRGILLLIGPYMTFQAAATAAGVAEIANESTPGAVAGHVRRTTAAVLVLALLNGAALLALPDAVGRLILDEAWTVAEPLVLPAALHVLCLALVVGPRAYLIGTKTVRSAIWIDMTTTVGIVVLGTVGAFAGGAEGAYWGTVVGATAAAVAWWGGLAVRRRHDHAPRSSLIGAVDEPR